jgi:hypothetical protein
MRSRQDGGGCARQAAPAHAATIQAGRFDCPPFAPAVRFAQAVVFARAALHALNGRRWRL